MRGGFNSRFSIITVVGQLWRGRGAHGAAKINAPEGFSVCWDRLVSGLPKGRRRLSGCSKGRFGILGRHRDRGLDIGQATPRRRSQYGGGSCFVVRELANHQPVMGAERQIPTYELTSDTLESLERASSRFSGLASKSLTASAVKRPREM